MYVEIIAKSALDKSRGKTSWINTGPNTPSITLESNSPQHLDRPPWHVVLKAEDYRGTGTGERGGELKDYEYSLEIHLTPADLASVVNFAVEKMLIRCVALETLKRKEAT